MEKTETLIIKRIFDAPINRVWDAFTVPSEAKKWWGPRNFTAPTVKIDFKVDGKSLFCMRGAPTPNGKVQDFWSTGTYKEIVPYKKIVTTDSFADKNGKIVSAEKYGMKNFPLELKITMNFEEKYGKTNFTLIHEGFPKGQGKLARQGWSESFDKLEESLRKIQKITPCLWFNNNAEEAVKYYTSIFKNSRILNVSRYDKASAKVSGQKEGSVLTIEFTLNGQQFLALNGGPMFKFSPATSFIVNCEDQKELDYYWAKLSKGGKKSVCGWSDDKFGVTWQVVPMILNKLLLDPDKTKASRVMSAMLKMKKIDIAKLKKAYEG